MSKCKVFYVLLIMIVILFLITACNGNSSENKNVTSPKETANEQAQKENKMQDIKVGFIYVGGVDDGGWTLAHNEGRSYLEKELGIKCIVREKVPESPECIDIVSDMIVKEGVNLVFATSFAYMDYIVELSKKFPNVKFMHCSGYKTTENMGNYFGKLEEARYLAGMIAGGITKSNKIGYVAAFEIPEVIRGINGFTLGVKAVNPNAKVIVEWSHTWADFEKEKAVAENLASKGVDVMSQHQDTTATASVCESKNIYFIGSNSDMSKAAPKMHLTSAVFNWGPIYVEQVEQVKNGNWKPVAIWKGIKDGIVDLSNISSSVSDDIKKKVEDSKMKIKNDELKIFKGPIKDNKGVLRVKDDEVMSDKQLLEWDWFIEGVEGTIEKF